MSKMFDLNVTETVNNLFTIGDALDRVAGANETIDRFSQEVYAMANQIVEYCDMYGDIFYSDEFWDSLCAEADNPFIIEKEYHPYMDDLAVTDKDFM